MNNFSKKLTLVAAAALCSVSAHAYYVDFNYVVPLDGSGKTSPVVGVNNVPTGTVFVETFDIGKTTANPSGCGINTPPGLVSISGGSYGIQSGSNSFGAMPAGDSTCYAFGPGPGRTAPTTVTLNYTGLLTTLPAGSYLNYLGLYYGSIDTYNDLSFYNSSNALITTVTGASLISEFGGATGNQFDDRTNIYVNLYFEPSEVFTSFSFTTRSVAFEMDNLAVGYNIKRQDVPEPETLALVGLGLLGLVASRRRKVA